MCLFALNYIDSSNDIIVDGTLAGEEAVDIICGSEIIPGPHKQGKLSCNIKPPTSFSILK